MRRQRLFCRSNGVCYANGVSVIRLRSRFHGYTYLGRCILFVLFLLRKLSIPRRKNKTTHPSCPLSAHTRVICNLFILSCFLLF